MCVLLIAIPFLIFGLVFLFKLFLWIVVGGTLIALLVGAIQAMIGGDGEDDETGP
jgi:hypothetical protein